MIGIGILMCVLSGCGPTKIHGLQQHVSFNYEHVMASSIVVGGVTTSLSYKLKPAKASYYSELLQQALLRERPNYNLVANGLLASRLGTEYRGIMDRFRMHGVVHIDDLRAVHHILPNTRYAMFARINHNDVRQEYEDYQYIEKNEKKDPRDDELVVKETFKTIRTLSASLAIYDLLANELVWSGAVNQSDTERNVYSHERPLHENWKKTMLDAFVTELLFGGASHKHYPPPMPTHTLLERVFIGFAENMPKQPKK
ncbi:MAG: hypothetical protein R8M38_10680 [Mariprofundaceae bacterium]